MHGRGCTAPCSQCPGPAALRTTTKHNKVTARVLGTRRRCGHSTRGAFPARSAANRHATPWRYTRQRSVVHRLPAAQLHKGRSCCYRDPKLCAQYLQAEANCTPVPSKAATAAGLAVSGSTHTAIRHPQQRALLDVRGDLCYVCLPLHSLPEPAQSEQTLWGLARASHSCQSRGLH